MPNVDWTNKNTMQNLINTVHERLVKKVAHYSVMPTPTLDLVGEIVQYIGATDANFINAYFYKCVEVTNPDTGAISYEWQAVDVQADKELFIEVQELPTTDIRTDAIYLVPKVVPETVELTGYKASFSGSPAYVVYESGAYLEIDEYQNRYGTESYVFYQTLKGDAASNVKQYLIDAGIYSETITIVDINRRMDNTKVEYINLDGTPNGWEKIGDPDTIQRNMMPEAAEDYVGRIYQYVGESDDNFINGFFYKCVEENDASTGAIVYNWTLVLGRDEHIELTQAEYEELPFDKYNDDKIYFITDGEDVESMVVYGWHVDPDESEPSDCLTYLRDAIGMSPAAMGSTSFNYGSWKDAFFMPKPCMLYSNGEVAYYLDPNDYTKKIDGTPSDVDNPDFDGNAMMEWGLIWFKFEAGNADGEGSFYVSNVKADEDFHCWCNYDSDNNIIPHFYTAIYNGTGTDKMRSLSGIELTAANGCSETTGQEEVDRATANNTTDKVEWYTDVWCDRILINALLVLICKSFNIHNAIGFGATTGVDTHTYTSGSLNNKGLFYGSQERETGVKIFGMEHWYGLYCRRVAGIVGVPYNSYSGRYKIKLTYGTADGSTAVGYNATGDGYIESIPRPRGISVSYASGSIVKMKYGDFGWLPYEVAEELPSTQYYCSWYIDTNAYETITAYGFVGGFATSIIYGNSPFRLDMRERFSHSENTISTTLSCKPCI